MKSIVVGTAGHIDHGKSALVRALTGTDPDRLKEEKARGITIDLGFAHATIGDLNFAFVDVPGHERFVKNMLAGVGGIDLVLLVVAADESVMPQTREHFDICRLLRIPSGLVVLTKADLVDSDTLDLVTLEVRELVAGSFLADAPVIPVSSKTGAGLETLRTALATAGGHVAGRTTDGAARLPIDRVFSMRGFGTVVTGTLVSGAVRVDDELELLPSGRTVKARGVQVHGEKREAAFAGQRTAINLSGIEVAEIDRGETLATPGAFESTRLADAVVELLEEVRPLRHGARVRFHQGTAEILGRVAVIGPAGESREVPTIVPGRRAFVRLRLESPAVVTRGDRYILRAYSPPLTIAGGQILDPAPPRGAIRTAAAAERARALDIDAANRDPDRAAVTAAGVMTVGAGAIGLPVQALISRVGVAPRHVDAIVRALADQSLARRVGEWLVSPAIVERLQQVVAATLSAHHKQQPLSDGISREELRDRVLPHGHPVLFDHIVDVLAAAGTVSGRDKLALSTHRVALTAEEERARSALEGLIRAAGLKPPDVNLLASEARVPADVADRMLKLLQRQKVLVRVDTMLFHDEALKQLKQDVAGLKTSAGGRIDVATFKERFGVSRKFAIPLLEYLDRERVTRRVGDARLII